ncbi:MAG TPA: hypothetical protein ENL05_00185 [Candidatus Moranbacteria bacterium]|nr:hypothetical protein [Candidatus Moranbacteria bacterium]
MKAKKSKIKKINKKVEKVFKESEVILLLENLNDNIQLLAEGQVGLREETNRKIDGLREEMNEKFSLIMNYLKKIDDEIMEIKKELGILKEKKVDWSAYSLLEKRVKKAEDEIERLNKLLTQKKKKMKA